MNRKAEWRKHVWNVYKITPITQINLFYFKGLLLNANLHTDQHYIFLCRLLQAWLFYI